MPYPLRMAVQGYACRSEEGMEFGLSFMQVFCSIGRLAGTRVVNETGGRIQAAARHLVWISGATTMDRTDTGKSNASGWQGRLG